jgi:DNA-binding MarR family transcriptional regulator
MAESLDTRRSISLRLTVMARLMRSDFDRHAGDIGLTRSQWSLIAVVTRRPGSTQKAIADLLEMSEASAGRLVDRLVADGVLERRDRSDDRRAKAIYMTPAAAPLLERMSKHADKREARMFKGMDEAQLTHFRDLLDIVYANMNP